MYVSMLKNTYVGSCTQRSEYNFRNQFSPSTM